MADRGWISLVWPVPSSKAITQAFGTNYDYYHNKFGWVIGHSGLDIRTKTAAFPNGIGTPIVAAQGGAVVHAGDHPEGYGRAVILKHSDNTCTLYGHNSEVLVRVGERVHAGQYIARSGSTGNSTGPHLHFELWDMKLKSVKGVWGRIDPTPFMEDIRFIMSFGERDIGDGDLPEDGSIPEEELPIHEGRRLDDAECDCRPFEPDY